MEKGYNRKRIQIQMKLLEEEYRDVSFPSNHYNKLYIITIGDYTEQGYKRKKEKLEAELSKPAKGKRCGKSTETCT